MREARESAAVEIKNIITRIRTSLNAFSINILRPFFRLFEKGKKYDSKERKSLWRSVTPLSQAKVNSHHKNLQPRKTKFLRKMSRTEIELIANCLRKELHQEMLFIELQLEILLLDGTLKVKSLRAVGCSRHVSENPN